LTVNAQPSVADFAMYLLSPKGLATLKAYGFIPVVQGDYANLVRDARHERTR
jgi:hypothetical protein